VSPSLSHRRACSFEVQSCDRARANAAWRSHTGAIQMPVAAQLPPAVAVGNVCANTPDRVVGVSAYTMHVDALDSATSYLFRVRAVSPAGPSGWTITDSVARTHTQRPDAPAPPEVLGVAATAAQLRCVVDAGIGTGLPGAAPVVTDGVRMQVAAAESGSALVNLSGGPPSLLPTLLDWREADVQEVVMVPGPTGGSDGRLVLDVVVQSLPPLAGCMFRFASRNEAGESAFSRPSNVVRTLGTAADAPWYGQTRTRSLSPRAGIEYKQPTMGTLCCQGSSGSGGRSIACVACLGAATLDRRLPIHNAAVS
jgi:hypothetical protein